MIYWHAPMALSYVLQIDRYQPAIAHSYHAAIIFIDHHVYGL